MADTTSAASTAHQSARHVCALSSRLVMGTARTHGLSSEGAHSWARCSQDLVLGFPDHLTPDLSAVDDPAERAELIVALSQARERALTALSVAHSRVELEVPADVRDRLLELTGA